MKLLGLASKQWESEQSRVNTITTPQWSWPTYHKIVIYVFIAVYTFVPMVFRIQSMSIKNSDYIITFDGKRG